jgi:uncharacterized protein YkwD
MIYLLILIFFLPVFSPTAVEFKQEILKEVNALRKKGCYCGDNYMPPVKAVSWNRLLERSAFLHAKDMHEKKYFSHIDRNGKDIGDRVHAVGYKWIFIGENIAEGQANIDELMEDWLKSETHCKLMMNSNFEEMGVSNYQYTWVQHFGKQL